MNVTHLGEGATRMGEFSTGGGLPTPPRFTPPSALRDLPSAPADPNAPIVLNVGRTADGRLLVPSGRLGSPSARDRVRAAVVAELAHLGRPELERQVLLIAGVLVGTEADFEKGEIVGEVLGAVGSTVYPLAHAVVLEVARLDREAEQLRAYLAELDANRKAQAEAEERLAARQAAEREQAAREAPWIALAPRTREALHAAHKLPASSPARIALEALAASIEQAEKRGGAGQLAMPEGWKP